MTWICSCWDLESDFRPRGPKSPINHRLTDDKDNSWIWYNDIYIYMYMCICIYNYYELLLYYMIRPFFPIPVDELHLFLVGCSCTVHRWHSLAFDPSLAARVEMSPSGESSLRLAGVFRLVDFRIFFRLVLLNVLLLDHHFWLVPRFFCSVFVPNDEWWWIFTWLWHVGEDSRSSLL